MTSDIYFADVQELKKTGGSKDSFGAITIIQLGNDGDFTRKCKWG